MKVIIALLMLVAFACTVSADTIRYNHNPECQIYVIYGQAPKEDHVTFQIEVSGEELDHAEFLVHHSYDVLPVILPYMQEFACNLMWLPAEG